MRKNLFAAYLIAWLTIAGTAPAAHADNSIVVVIKGAAKGMTYPIPITNQGTVQGNCFTVPLLDLRTDKEIGTALECMSDVYTSNGGFATTATTYFHFAEGILVSRLRATAQPIIEGSPLMTHITGGIPAPGDNQILYGTGKFKNAKGAVRLSGAVNMSNFGNNEIIFDCIFVINLQPGIGAQ